MSNLFKKLEVVSTINNIKDNSVVTPEVENQVIFGNDNFNYLEEATYEIPKYNGVFAPKKEKDQNEIKNENLQKEYDKVIDSFRAIESKSMNIYKRAILEAKTEDDKELREKKIQKAKAALQKAIISVFDDLDALNSQEKYSNIVKVNKTEFTEFYQNRNIGL